MRSALFLRARPGDTRRGVASVYVAINLIVVFSFAALAVDLGYLFTVRTELQRTADAAALAAVSRLAAGSSPEEARGIALATAKTMGESNTAACGEVDFTLSDLEFGTHEYDSGRMVFVDGATDHLSAVRVTARKRDLPLFFAPIMGVFVGNVEGRAAAALQPRDIAVVIDLSGSMKHDSYLRFHQSTQINARDVWCSLDGPEPSRPYTPGAEDETEYASDTGPTIGVMDTWGDPLVPGVYNATTDPGLWYIPNNAPCTVVAISTKLAARGYSAARITSIMAGPSTTWSNRAAVMIGVANWTPSSGSDTSVSSGELTWIGYPPYRKNWVWADYMSWMSGTDNKLFPEHPQFKFRFGLKTYLDWLLDNKDNFSQTDFTNTPEEPLTAVKDAVQELVTVTSQVDQLALTVFASTAHHEVNLTLDRQPVADVLYARQANHYDNSTSIGGGMQLAINELLGPRARDSARKIMLLMSDGENKTGPDPLEQAARARDEGILIYSVSVGSEADRDLMIQIATITGGQEFYAFGNPEQYTEQLRNIFRQIGGLRQTVLIE